MNDAVSPFCYCSGIFRDFVKGADILRYAVQLRYCFLVEPDIWDVKQPPTSVGINASVKA